MGMKCVIFMPDTQSQEKVDMLKVLGATVHQVPAVPFDNPDNYNHQVSGNQPDFIPENQSNENPPTLLINEKPPTHLIILITITTK